jgi:hypothetical protein
LEHLCYRRHFLWLTGFSVALLFSSRWRLPLDRSSAFALYGSLHALALTLSTRASRRVWKSCFFIAVAAALSVMTFRAGLIGRQWVQGLTSGAGTYALLAASSMLGAMAYGISVRAFNIAPLSLPSLAAISAGCALASCAALFSRRCSDFLGLWWLAVTWWYAFSGGLWYSERRRRRETSRPPRSTLN